jgi:N6-L-threonylcarbamoyladenine synthase
MEKRIMNLLAVETSCDETAAAVLDAGRRVLGSVVLSQDEVHAPYSGVVPELASRQHLKSIGWVVEECLNRAGLMLPRIDAYAVTQGPGLIGSLLVGLSFVKGLAYYFRKPLIGIDHLEAHMEAAFLERPELPFPCLAIVVSGGHTSLFFLKKRFQSKLLGRTRDDAAGEALDKVAKFLDLGYPGGPVIQKLAENGDAKKFFFALPRMKDESLDFSFSGLKTAALKKIRETGMSKNHPALADFLAGFEEAIARAVLDNFSRAAEIYRPKSLVISGGVARNKRLRTRFLDFSREQGFEACVPSPELCTDNAVMVASLAVEKLKSQKTNSGSLDLDAYPRFNP